MRKKMAKAFDAVFYNFKQGDYADRIISERKMLKEVVNEDYYFIEKNNFYGDIDKVIKSYKPVNF